MCCFAHPERVHIVQDDDDSLIKRRRRAEPKEKNIAWAWPDVVVGQSLRIWSKCVYNIERTFSGGDYMDIAGDDTHIQQVHTGTHIFNRTQAQGAWIQLQYIYIFERIGKIRNYRIYRYANGGKVRRMESVRQIWKVLGVERTCVILTSSKLNFLSVSNWCS